jgi:hypothetical protein
MGGGRIFLKSLRDTFFNKDLLNEPNFSRIHLAGQYLEEGEGKGDRLESRLHLCLLFPVLSCLFLESAF